MGLHINTYNRHRSDFKTAYLQFVKERNGGFGFWPKKWDAYVDNILMLIDKLGDVNIPTFVRAQFDSMSKKFCLKTFKTPYPPLSTFGTDKAAKRYRIWQSENFFHVAGEKGWKEAEETIKAGVTLFLKEYRDDDGTLDPNIVKLAYTTGVLNLVELAYMVEHKILDKSVADELVDFLADADPNIVLKWVEMHTYVRAEEEKAGADGSKT